MSALALQKAVKVNAVLTNMNEPVIGYVAATAMGFVLGVLGGGGSILTVPILVYLCHANASLATSYSLWIVGITALVGTAKYARSRHVSYQIVFTFGAPSILGVTFARGYLLPRIPEQIWEVGNFQLTKDVFILVIFALLMVVAGLAMIYQQPLENTPSTQGPKIKHLNRFQGGVLGFEGFLVGVLTGLVGAGGGFIIVPVLVMLLGLPVRMAIGTSLAIICVKSFFGLLADRVFWIDANWRFLLLFSAASVTGILLGSLMAGKVSTGQLKIGFGWFALFVGFFMLSKELLF